MPWWKSIVEKLTDDNVSEITVLKCKRGGGSENLACSLRGGRQGEGSEEEEDEVGGLGRLGLEWRSGEDGSLT